MQIILARSKVIRVSHWTLMIAIWVIRELPFGSLFMNLAISWLIIPRSWYFIIGRPFSLISHGILRPFTKICRQVILPRSKVIRVGHWSLVTPILSHWILPLRGSLSCWIDGRIVSSRPGIIKSRTTLSFHSDRIVRALSNMCVSLVLTWAEIIRVDLRAIMIALAAG